MLFHALYAPGSGVYVEQLALPPRRASSTSRAFARAWQRVVDRHAGPAHRASSGTGSDRAAAGGPAATSSCPGSRRTGAALPAAEQRRALAATSLAADRRARLRPRRGAPLLRLALRPARASAATASSGATTTCCSTAGRMPLVLQRGVRRLRGRHGGGETRLPPARPYRDYIAWLRGRTSARRRPSGARALAGFAAPDAAGGRPPREREPAAGGRSRSAGGPPAAGDERRRCAGPARATS